MATAHSPAGYTGSVDQAAEARRFALAGGGLFRVASSADWALAVSTTVDRTVTIAAGQGAACGIWDQTAASDSVAFAANPGGQDRLDAIVAKFDWTARTVAFAVLAGTTIPPLVNGSSSVVDNAKINRMPGLLYDAILGVVRIRPGVTTLSSGDLTDLRVWGEWGALTTPGTGPQAGLIDIGIGAQLTSAQDGTMTQKNSDSSFTVVPRMWVQSAAPTGTIPNGSVWFQV